MPRKTVLMDEFHVTLAVPRNLTPAASRAIRRALNRPGLRAALGRAVRDVLRRYPSLAKVKVTISQ